MTFGSVFGRTFSPTFQPKSQAVAKAVGIVVYDTFTDTDAVLLSNHTPEICPSGSTWGGGAATNLTIITTNAACSPDWYSTSMGCGIDTGLVNCKITATVKAYGYNSNFNYRNSGIRVRCNSAADSEISDSSTWYGIVVNSHSDKFQIIEKASGNSYTVLSETSVTMDSETSYTLVATVSGTTITATLDGANEISYSSASVNSSSTIHGVKPSTYNNIKTPMVLDFQVESI